MTPRDRRHAPLLSGGQGRSPGEVLLGALVVALCAAGVLAIAAARAAGVL